MPYQILNRDGSLTLMGWASNVPAGGMPGRVPASAIFNPYVQYQAFKPAGLSIANAHQFAQDPNGNTTSASEYDWMPSSNIQQTGGNFVTSISGSATRTAALGYYEFDQGSSAYYWNHGAPVNLRARKNATSGTTTATYTYDNPLSTANLTNAQASDTGTQCSPVCPTTVTTSTAYLTNGNVSTQTDANGFVTQVTYDGSSLYPYQVAIAQGQTEQRKFQYSFDFNSGLKNSVTDLDNGITTSYTYDNLGRPKQTNETTSLLSRSATINYDDVNATISTTSDDLPGQSLTSTTYFRPSWPRPPGS